MQLKSDWATFPKHWSTWLAAAVIVFDAAYVFIDALGPMMSPQTVVMLNAAVAAGMKFLQLLKQNIPLTTEQKAGVVSEVAAKPMQPGEENVAVKIDGETVPSTPKTAAAG
jgi:hypothetical protein